MFLIKMCCFYQSRILCISVKPPRRKHICMVIWDISNKTPIPMTNSTLAISFRFACTSWNNQDKPHRSLLAPDTGFHLWHSVWQTQSPRHQLVSCDAMRRADLFPALMPYITFMALTFTVNSNAITILWNYLNRQAGILNECSFNDDITMKYSVLHTDNGLFDTFMHPAIMFWSSLIEVVSCPCHKICLN